MNKITNMNIQIENKNNEFETFLTNHNLQTLLQYYQQEKNNILASNRKNFVGLIVENILQYAEKEINGYEKLIKSIEDALEYWGNYKTYCSDDEQEVYLFYTYFEDFLNKLQHDKNICEERSKEFQNFNYILMQRNIINISNK